MTRSLAVVDDLPSGGSCLIPSRQLDTLGIYESTPARAAARCAVEAVKRSGHERRVSELRVWVQAYAHPMNTLVHVVHRFDMRVTPKGDTQR